jgi:hypothetical protein
VPGQSKKFANAPNFIRINLPKLKDWKTDIWKSIQAGGHTSPTMALYLDCTGKLAGKQFWCCPTRKIVDEVLDNVSTNYTSVYPSNIYNRDVRCLIDHMNSCEFCGPKCDSCGYRCPNVCPKGKC